MPTLSLLEQTEVDAHTQFSQPITDSLDLDGYKEMSVYIKANINWASLGTTSSPYRVEIVHSVRNRRTDETLLFAANFTQSSDDFNFTYITEFGRFLRVKAFFSNVTPGSAEDGALEVLVVPKH